jgi:hypothetical protein
MMDAEASKELLSELAPLRAQISVIAGAENQHVRDEQYDTLSAMLTGVMGKDYSTDSSQERESKSNSTSTPPAPRRTHPSPSCPVFHPYRITFPPEVEQELVHAYGKEAYDSCMARLPVPPRTTVVRVNTLLATRESVLLALSEHLKQVVHDRWADFPQQEGANSPSFTFLPSFLHLPSLLPSFLPSRYE